MYPDSGKGALKPFMLDSKVSLRPETAGCITKRCGVSGKKVSSLRAIIVDPSMLAFFPTSIVVHALSFIQIIPLFKLLPAFILSSYANEFYKD
ncbi:hypothetical protein LPO01_11660 [Ligilactobacillus pobuzihii]|nr:hypothetical protein LPO01_11660 [Ligilactobacillus pobuzihii]